MKEFLKNTHQWPKRRQARCLGPFSSLLPITDSRLKRGWGLVVRCHVKTTHRLVFVARVGRCRCGRVVVVVVVESDGM